MPKKVTAMAYKVKCRLGLLKSMEKRCSGDGRETLVKTVTKLQAPKVTGERLRRRVSLSEFRNLRA
jgi:hypothetical protein